MAKRKKRWMPTVARMISAEELRAIMSVIPRIDTMDETRRRESLVLWILINTGLRAEEVCNLRAQDTPRYMPKMSGEFMLFVYNGKGQVDRGIPCSPKLAHHINRYIDEIRPRTMPKRYKKTDKRGWLFWKGGKKMNHDQIYYIVTKYVRKAGIERTISPHYFRHTFATDVLAGKHDLYAAQRMLGHSTSKMTEKYTHITNYLGKAIGKFLDERTQGFMF